MFLFEMLDNSVLNVALPTIGRSLHASTAALQWVTSSYAVVFGGLMIALSAVADRWGRRLMMIIGLLTLAVASLATFFVATVHELIMVRAVMGLAAAMTTPGSLALAFRLFDEERLRIRAMTLISTVGLIGLGVGPVAGGVILDIAPWQVLLVANAPMALVALVSIRFGAPADDPAGLHAAPIDILGALLGTTTIVLALVAPTLLVEMGAGSWQSWAAIIATVAAAAFFVMWERAARHPLLDLAQVTRPLVSSGLAFKAAAGIAIAGLGFLVTLQLQLAWRWSPGQAALGMLPQVLVLIAGGAAMSPLVKRVGVDKAGGASAALVVIGLAVYAGFGQSGYLGIAIALVCVAVGMRLVGVVAGNNVMRGLPPERTTMGAALIDTAGQIATGIGIALAGTVIAAVFNGTIAAPDWTSTQAGQFREGLGLAGLALTLVAGVLVVAGVARQVKQPGTHSPSA